MPTRSVSFQVKGPCTIAAIRQLVWGETGSGFVKPAAHERIGGFPARPLLVTTSCLKSRVVRGAESCARAASEVLTCSPIAGWTFAPKPLRPWALRLGPILARDLLHRRSALHLEEMLIGREATGFGLVPRRGAYRDGQAPSYDYAGRAVSSFGTANAGLAGSEFWAGVPGAVSDTAIEHRAGRRRPRG
jgi:hypothetical protein